MTPWDPPEVDGRRNPYYVHWDELGYLHNHTLEHGVLKRYHSACDGCDRREDENP